MDIPLAAIKHIPFIILGIWPVNLLTLLVTDHSWGWKETPPAVMEIWEWGAFVSLSLAILTELGVQMFVALARLRRERERMRAEAQAAVSAARAEGLSEGRSEARAEARAELGLIFAKLALATPEQQSEILSEYLEQYVKDNDAAQD